MPKGGARSGSGPAPDLGALKRVRDGKEWIKLPKLGLKEAAAPLWPAHMPDHEGMPDPRPLRVNATELMHEAHDERAAKAARSQTRAMAMNERERDYWQRLWTQQPQAHVWRADGTEDVVALFVRTMLEASEPGSSTTARTLVKQLASDLLLNTAALHSAKYVIDREMEGEPAMPNAAAHIATGTTGAGPIRSVREGLTIVPPPVDDEDDDE